MKPSAVLLIDLENFFLSRVQYFNEKSIPAGSRPAFAKDFEQLITFAQRMAGAPFAVRRAYADYVTLRVGPRELMRQGVEPVQVFRLSGARSGSKNAADMRMAMDATALLASAGHAEQFVLVTGDADFIPVILELKRHGRAVSVIGVTGATNELIQRFVDNFELFEDLLAAEEVEVRSGELAMSGDGMEKVAAAVRRLLGRNRPLRFAAIKPLLSKELDYPFDPGVFGCDTTGDFLRKFASELGVVIRQGQHDSEIDLPSAVPSANGNGSKVTIRPPTRQGERPTAKPAAAPIEHHTVAHYRQLLAGRGQQPSNVGTVKVPAVPWPVLVWGCDAVVSLLAPPAGEPTHTTSLLPKLLKAADGSAIPELVKHLRLFYPILRAGLPVQGADGVYALPEGATVELIRRSVLNYIGYVLANRLSENSVPGDIRAESLAGVFDPDNNLDDAVSEITAALAQPAPTPAPAPPKPAKPLPSVEEMHTPASYLKLLKVGGARGSETESLKILPVPWTSVERVCADAFPLLCPGAGGCPLPREQLNTRLVDSGKDLFIDQYPQHVRRALGLLRVAGDLTEENGAVGLHADITSAAELRNRALAFLLQLLQLRLEERELYDPIHPHAFVAALEGGPLTDRLVEEVTPAIAWLYRPDEAGAEPGEQALPEAAAEAQPEPATVAPSPDSGCAAGEMDSVVTELELALSPTNDPTPEPAAEPAKADSEPTWDPYAFDGVLPDADPPTEANYNTPPADPPQTDATREIAPTADSASTMFGMVDVAVITSEAVAAAVAEAVEALPAAVTPEPEPEPFAFAPSVSSPAPPANGTPPQTEEILPTVPVADWLPDGDPLFSEIALMERKSAPPTVTPVGLPAETDGPVAKITPPPLPAASQPSPYPPLPPPPESA